MNALTSRLDEAGRLIIKKDRRVFPLLKQLKKEIKASNDHSLIGAHCFMEAHAAYHFGAYGRLCGHIKSAVRHLLRSDDIRLLARSYNLFAVNAHRIGLYDVAYNYFLLAYSLIKDDKDCIERAIIDINLGELLADMGDYKGACERIRLSIPSIEKNKTYPSRIENLIIAMINLGLYTLYDGNHKEAGEMMKKAEMVIEESGDDVGEIAALWMLLFQTEFALAIGDRRKMIRLLDEVIEKIIRHQVFAVFIKEIQRFFNTLISEGEWNSAVSIIEEIEKNEIDDVSAHYRMLIVQMQIDYYKTCMCHQHKKLAERYEARHILLRLVEEERCKVYHESVKLMNLTDEISVEQESTREENKRLQTQAEQDALTGLPNRRALNHMLEQTFERAREKNCFYGIGIMDIDRFKEYNDCYGHQRGDDCLVNVARVLQKVSRNHRAYCARYGGDEFVLIYEDMSEDEIVCVERLILEESPVSITHGFYMAHAGDSDRVWDYLSKADANLYIKKQNREKKDECIAV